MQNVRSIALESAEDIFFGQSVINWARWFVIAAAAVLILWTADTTSELVIGILPVVALMAVNFYLHGRRLAEQPANPAMVTMASLLDIVGITAIILFWPVEGFTGFDSRFFIAYFPVVLAFAFVMPPRISLAYTGLALVAYTGACFLVDPVFSSDADKAEGLVARLIALAAMGGLGTYFWRIQRNRRRKAASSLPELHSNS